MLGTGSHERPGWYPPEGVRITVFTGDYGSGKTEVAVNFAVSLHELEGGVTIADMDLVNPYFRSREALDLMEARGVEVLTPRGEQLTSELPIVMPEVKGLLGSKDRRAIIDLGGDDVGARVFSSLNGAWAPEELEALFVVNANRPFTDTVEGVERFIDRISLAARMPITGLVVNTHLMEHTEPDDIYRGNDLAAKVAARRGIRLRFVAVMQRLLSEIDPGRLAAPIFPLARIMVPPWLGRERLGKDRFNLNHLS